MLKEKILMKNFSKNLLQVYIINYLIFYRIQLFQKKPSNFKLFDRKVLNELKRFKRTKSFFVGIVPWLGFKSEGILLIDLIESLVLQVGL